MNKKLVVISLFLLLFLIGCVNKQPAQAVEEIENETKPSEVEPGTCTGKWICISSNVKAFQDENCELSNRTTCKKICQDGVCSEEEIKICIPGFKCRNQYERAFQRESCGWDKRERCEYGCDLSNNKCHTASIMNTTKAVETTEKPAPNPIISLGEVQPVNNQNLTIYILEPDRVKLKINQQRSEWLNEGQTFTSISGVKITVVEILFQPYEGGNRKIVYKVG